MSRPGIGSSDRVLIVEGSDDEHVVRRIWERCEASQLFQVEQKGGIDTLLNDLGSDILAPGRQSVGIVVDANDDIAARWAAVRNRLLEEDVHAPASPEPLGTVIASRDGKPRIGIWLMPDNESDGELEDFAIRMIPDKDSIWPLSERYIDSIPESERLFISKKKTRAQLYAWLAVRKDPRTMGWAIEAKDLDVDGELCHKFVDWLTRLFR